MRPNLLSLRPEAVSDWHRLCGQLASLADEGRATPCVADPDPFTSESTDDRAAAAEACAWCPALRACARFADANREPAHVWGGTDRTSRGAQQRKAA